MRVDASGFAREVEVRTGSRYLWRRDQGLDNARTVRRRRGRATGKWLSMLGWRGVPRGIPALEADRIKEVRDVVPGFLCYAYKVSTVSRKPAQSRKAVRARWRGVTLACSKEDGQLCPMHKSTTMVNAITTCNFDVVRTARLHVVKTTSLDLTDLLPPSFRPTGSFRVLSPIMRSAL